MSIASDSQTVPILYAEDDENDILLLQCALKKARLPHPLHVVQNGEQLIEYLKAQGRYADRRQYPLPGLLLLDLHLPRCSGLKALEWIQQEPRLASIPIVVYSSSEHPKDVQGAKALGVKDYIVKAATVDEIAKHMQRLAKRWLPATGS